jgi:hypothetical protein
MWSKSEVKSHGRVGDIYIKQIDLRTYLLRYLVIRAAMRTLTTTIYEIVIILVKLQTDYRYPNIPF